MPAKKRVLLVDDYPKLMKFLEVDLKVHGFDVITVSSGQQGLDQVKTNSIDIMVLDIRMPDMDGFEVLQHLRKFSNLPVIAYSATPEYSSRALKCGADIFIAKPFNPDYLMSLIDELTESGD